MKKPPVFSLGYEWDRVSGRLGKRLNYAEDRHIMCFGPTRSGKGISLEMPNLLRMGDGRLGGGPISTISVDPKGQNAAVCARFRKKLGTTTVFINPFNLHGLGSSGFNPLARLDPTSPHFFRFATNIAEALVPANKETNSFFTDSARNLALFLIIVECKEAHRRNRAPLLTNVKQLASSKLDELVAYIIRTDPKLGELGRDFGDSATARSTGDILKTFGTATRWLLDPSMASDLAKDGIDFAKLRGPKPVSVFLMLDPDALVQFGPWLRLLVASAFNALYRDGGGRGLNTIFFLSEFAQLGKLSMVETALMQGAGYGIRLFPVLQDINQLRTIYGKESANTFLGMSGATFAFAPNDPETAEWMSQRAGEHYVPLPSISDDPQTGEQRDSWNGHWERIYKPFELYALPSQHGLVYYAGESFARTVYAPPYWLKHENPDLIGRYDPDPFHAPERKRWWG